MDLTLLVLSPITIHFYMFFLLIRYNDSSLHVQCHLLHDFNKICRHCLSFFCPSHLFYLSFHVFQFFFFFLLTCYLVLGPTTNCARTNKHMHTQYDKYFRFVTLALIQAPLIPLNFASFGFTHYSDLLLTPLQSIRIQRKTKLLN